MSVPERFLKKLNNKISKYRKIRKERKKSFLGQKVLWRTARARQTETEKAKGSSYLMEYK